MRTQAFLTAVAVNLKRLAFAFLLLLQIFAAAFMAQDDHRAIAAA